MAKPEREEPSQAQREADDQFNRDIQWLLKSMRWGGVLVVSVLIVLVTHAVIEANQRPDEPQGSGTAKAPPASDSNVKFEEYKRPDPTLPDPPPGPVKKFKVDVFEHVTRVADDKPPTRVWSFGVNGVLYRGTGASVPMVVEQGDKVEVTLINGGSKQMDVKMPHSIDFHSSEVAPNRAFKTIQPGEKFTFSFVAKHPGVYMYHCATQPVLQHTGAGMVGMMIVKPKNLPPVDRELWVNQQEYYLGAPGKEGDLRKMQAKAPDVIAFNGYASQYEKDPIRVKKGERIRMYVMNSGPSIWSAFHVIGTVFDRTVVEGVVGTHAQSINLAPSQGGWVEFTLDEEGVYPFVTHAFGDAVKGAIGKLATANAPESAYEGGGHDHGRSPPRGGGNPGGIAEGRVPIVLGEMFVRPGAAKVKAGKVTFEVKNTGQIPHSFGIGTTPIKTDGSGDPVADSLTGVTKLILPGGSATLEVELKTGQYELVCTVTGHYAAGQKAPFEVVE